MESLGGPRCRGVVVVIVSMILVLVMMPSLTVGSSDPRAALCDPICWEEEALSDQCVEDRCSAHRLRSRAYRRCEDRCWNLVAPCRRMCNNKAMRVLEQCDRTCAGPNDANGMTTTTEQPGCQMDCFTHNMMLIKARILPSGYLNASPTSSAA
ncbi:hypothetical protein ACOMHN_011251 [Nucella lapillus]